MGKHLVNVLNREPHYNIYILDKADCTDIDTEKTFVGDVSNTSFLTDTIVESKPDIIYYLITNFSVNSIDAYLSALKTSVINLNNLYQCLNTNIRLVYLGSSAQYGRIPIKNQPVSENTGFNPVSNYGVIKALEEIEIIKLSEKFNVDTMIARIFNITGPGEPIGMVGGSFVSQLIKGNRLEVGNLFPKRDFLDVRDAVDALKIIGSKGKPTNVYNICSGRSISIKELLDLIVNEIKCNPEIEVSPTRINKSEIEDLVGDNSKLKNLGWKQKYSLDLTIKDLVASYRKKYYERILEV